MSNYWGTEFGAGIAALVIVGVVLIVFWVRRMIYTHVVSALKNKRIQVVSQIEALQGQLRQATIDLDHVEAALRLFDPDVDLAALSPRKVAPVLYDTKGDTGRIILETLRTSMRPLSTAHVTAVLQK